MTMILAAGSSTEWIEGGESLTTEFQLKRSKKFLFFPVSTPLCGYIPYFKRERERVPPTHAFCVLYNCSIVYSYIGCAHWLLLLPPASASSSSSRFYTTTLWLFMSSCFSKIAADDVIFFFAFLLSAWLDFPALHMIASLHCSQMCLV